MIVRRGEDDYEPTPTGLHQAVCANCFDLGLQSGWEGKTQSKLALIFEIDARRSDGKRFTVSKEFTASLHEKATLRGFLVSWRGRDFSAAELEGFEMNSLIGVNCCLNLVEKAGKDGKIYAEIAAIMRIQRGSQVMQIETPATFTPGWIKRKQDNQQIPGYNGVPAEKPSRPVAAPRPVAPPAKDDKFEDDIPF